MYRVSDRRNSGRAIADTGRPSRIAAAFGCVLSLLMCGLAGGADAGVNMRNGNFYITYTDVIVPGPSEFHLNRTYNSKAAQDLAFGIGWGSPLFTQLRMNGDGSVTFHHNGSGATDEFVPANRSGAALEAQLDAMIDGMERGGWIMSDETRRTTRAKLAGDAELRRALYRKMVREGLAPAADLAIGTRLLSGDPETFIVREAGGYYKRSRDGHERFDADGRLVESVSARDADFRLRYDARGHLRGIVTEQGTVLAVETDSDGNIVAVRKGDEVATYEYDAAGNLVRAVNEAGGIFVYEYGEQSYMTAIRYQSGAAMTMTYTAETRFLETITQRDGSVTRYEYGSREPQEEGIVAHDYTRRYRYNSAEDDTPHSDDMFEYLTSVDAYGTRYVVGEIFTIDGVTTETRRHPCGQPTLKRRGNWQTVFDYDDDCRLILKRSESEEIRLEYDRRSGKISHVLERDLLDGSESESWYSYDLRGQLTEARNGRGQKAVLSYDDRQRIVAMADETGLELTFVYNERGKPVRIAITGMGAIDVSYDASDEITGVTSDQGHEMALRVTQAFQALLALVKPAGVNFNL